jgi:CubicO group peptidase (beta-lactamase class C family)
MLFRFARAILTVLALGLMPSIASAQVPKFVDSLFADMRAATGPGCVIAFDSAGSRRWLTSFGLRDLERGGRNDSMTVFEAGSVSKQFAAAAVVLLAREGKLSLEDDIRRWIPELRDFGGTTVREILTHQSGWRDWRDLVEMSRWPSGTAAYTLQDALALFANQRALNFPSGTEYGYSNTNYALAAILVERVSGETLRSFTHRAIFAPLGMRQTLWRDSLSEVVRHRALAWTPTDSGRYRLDMPFETVVGPGGLLTTAPDLMKWLRNFETQQVGGPGFTEAMERVGVLRSGRATAYAMGLQVETLAGERLVSHAGWTGGYVAWAGRLPRRRLALSILCNGSAVNTEELGPELMARLARVAPPSTMASAPRAPVVGPSTPPILPTPAALGEYVGRYRSDEANAVIELQQRGDHLVAWRGGILRDDVMATSRDAFRVPSQSWRILMRRDSTGRVTGFDLGLPRMRRLPFERLPLERER